MSSKKEEVYFCRGNFSERYQYCGNVVPDGHTWYFIGIEGFLVGKEMLCVSCREECDRKAAAFNPKVEIIRVNTGNNVPWVDTLMEVLPIIKSRKEGDLKKHHIIDFKEKYGI